MATGYDYTVKIEMCEDILKLRGTEPSTRMEVYKRIAYFDWWYEYSDSGSVYRSGVAAEERLWEELEEALSAEEVTHLRGLDYKGRVKWALDKYPYLELESYRNVNPRGIVGKLLEGASVVDLRKGERLYRELIAVMRLPGVQACQGRFIRTPAEPSERVMRLRAKETGQVRYWGYNPGSEGQAAIEKLHHTIKVLGGAGKGSILELAVAATPEYNTAFDERLVARIEADDGGTYLYVGYGQTQLYFYI